MKRILFLLMLAIASLQTVNVRAQTNPCGCTSVITYEDYVHVVNVDAFGDPLDFIVIRYKKVTCGGNIGISFISATFISPGGFFNSGNWKTHYKAAQQQVLILEGAGAGNLSYVYPEKCQALIEITYPRGAMCYWTIPEGPGAGQTVSAELGKTLDMMECKGAGCCKVEYKYDVTTGRYKLINPIDDFPCPNPPPNIKTRTYTCKDKNGNDVTYTGTVKILGPCESFCGLNNTLFRTTVSGAFQPMPLELDVNIKPVPAHDFITLSSTEHVAKIEIYDVAGRKVMEQSRFDNPTIDISALAPGVHVVRVYSDDNSLRTIKIIKE